MKEPCEDKQIPGIEHYLEQLTEVLFKNVLSMRFELLGVIAEEDKEGEYTVTYKLKKKDDENSRGPDTGNT